MASVYQEANGSRRIGFTNLEGERKSIRLGMMNAKTADTFCKRVEELLGNQAANHSNDVELSTWLRDLPEIMYGRLAATGLVPPREALKVPTLRELVERFESGLVVRQSTVVSYKQAFASLLAYFKPDTPIDTVTPAQAEQWRKWLATPSEQARRLAPPTQAKRLKVVRGLFAAAVRWELLPRNPFANMKAGSMANAARNFYVPKASIEAALAECPSDEWRAIIAGARFAGLRTPSEIRLLEWTDINWAKSTMCVKSPKTSHIAGHDVRFVPLAPTFRAILQRLFENAPEGSRFVVPWLQSGDKNLGTQFARILKRANVKRWPRLFHNCRASCATDWAQTLPAHAVARWLGHSPLISASHYLMPLDEHFAVVTGESDTSASQIEAGAKCGATLSEASAQPVQNRVQQQPASTRTNSAKHSKMPPNRGPLRELATCGENPRSLFNGPGGT
jgi:integrase